MCFDRSFLFRFSACRTYFSCIVKTYFSPLDLVKFEIIPFYMHLWFHCFNKMRTYFETLSNYLQICFNYLQTLLRITSEHNLVTIRARKKKKLKKIVVFCMSGVFSKRRRAVLTIFWSLFYKFLLFLIYW